METETPKSVPILNVAWTRYAQLNDVSKRRSRAYRRLRIWIAVLGILATLFAILTQFGELQQAAAKASGAAPDPLLAFVILVIKIFFISIPIIASVLAAFGTRAFRNGDWLITRAAAEEYLKEIFLYRTILQKSPGRREYLENRINDIQQQLYRGMGGELGIKQYKGPIPPHYDPKDPNSDPGTTDINGEQYFKFRLEDQLGWHQDKILEYQRERSILTFLVLAAGGAGAFFAAWGAPFSIWVALIASITAALIGWQELRNIDSIIKNYSKVTLELSSIHDHWLNLEPEERTEVEFYKMVRKTENVLWAQSTEYIKFMQEALKESSLEGEAGLVNRVIQESEETEKRTKQALQDELFANTKEVLAETERQTTETFTAVMGTLAEEASSEIVQQELEAMSKAVTDTVENLKERASTFKESLAQIAQEFAHVDIGRDTSPEELNTILARYPKTNDVKG
jgi:hypothetical protein